MCVPPRKRYLDRYLLADTTKLSLVGAPPCERVYARTKLCTRAALVGLMQHVEGRSELCGNRVKMLSSRSSYACRIGHHHPSSSALGLEPRFSACVVTRGDYYVWSKAHASPQAAAIRTRIAAGARGGNAGRRRRVRGDERGRRRAARPFF